MVVQFPFLIKNQQVSRVLYNIVIIESSGSECEQTSWKRDNGCEYLFNIYLSYQ